MENNRPDYTYNSVFQMDDSETASRKYLAKVFTWMFLALGISAFFALEFFLNKGLLSLLVEPGVGLTGLGYAAIFAPVAFSMVISFGFNRICLCRNHRHKP
jgi:FtsH-binding integral membrane protein